MDRPPGRRRRAVHHAHAHNVVTLPSHANILTGRLPLDHGVRDNAGFRLPADERHARHRLEAAGFRTGAFVSAFPLDSRFGLRAGSTSTTIAFADAAPRPAFLDAGAAGRRDRRSRAHAGCERRLKPAVVLLGSSLRAALPLRAAGALRLALPGDPYLGEVAPRPMRPSARCSQPILDAGDGGRHAGHRHLGSRRVARRTRRGDARHLRLRGDAEGAPGHLLIRDSRARDRRRPARHVDIAADRPRRARAADSAGSPGAACAGDGRRPNRGDRHWYFEALSGSLNRGWAPLSGSSAEGSNLSTCPFPSSTISAPTARATEPATPRPPESPRLRALLASPFAANRPGAPGISRRGGTPAQPRLRHGKRCGSRQSATPRRTIPSG